jgi:hypothetical protein
MNNPKTPESVFYFDRLRSEHSLSIDLRCRCHYQQSQENISYHEKRFYIKVKENGDKKKHPSFGPFKIKKQDYLMSNRYCRQNGKSFASLSK